MLTTFTSNISMQRKVSGRASPITSSSHPHDSHAEAKNATSGVMGGNKRRHLERHFILHTLNTLETMWQLQEMKLGNCVEAEKLKK
eukprot:5399555-Ditylum_brightwellii.AAC.1